MNLGNALKFTVNGEGNNSRKFVERVEGKSYFRVQLKTTELELQLKIKRRF
jgi:hypothetical protein